jgi:uncharacterized protein YkwD
VPRKLLVTVAALVTFAMPAAAEARGFTAHRLAAAHAGTRAMKSVLATTARTPSQAAVQAQVPAECPNADLVPDPGNLETVRAAILCLHNKVRAENRLRPLHPNARLRAAAERHSSDMVSASFFDHTTPRGVTMVDRILGARYVRADRGWVLGENLEWGTGSLATPRGAVQAWLDSPGHRANLLKRGYRDMGVGIALGTPTGAGDGATYTVDFGARG